MRTSRVAVALQGYLARVEGDASVQVGSMADPDVLGLSNLTSYFTLRRAGSAEEPLVLKREPRPGFVHAIPVQAQARLIRRLAEISDLPLPRVRWSEGSPAELGAPFMIMDRVGGAVPPSAPSMHAAGYFVGLEPHRRRVAFEEGIRCLAALHAVDPADPGVASALGPVRTDRFRAGMDSLRRQYENLASPSTDLLERAFDWLAAREVADSPAVVCWGDARPGNLVYDGTAVVAMLDWEMAGVGSPESDLAWWLSLDEFQSRGMRVPRLEGIPDADEQLALYIRLTGRHLQDLGVHRLAAALRMAVISLELEQLYLAALGAGQRPGVGLVLRHLDRQLASAVNPPHEGVAK